MKRIFCPFLFITSAENLEQNVVDCVVDSENNVSGRGFKDKQVWQLSTQSAMTAVDPGQ